MAPTTAALPAAKRNWKRIQPTSLRHALELCKDHAKARLNLSVEGIAAAMGVTDHWTLYKWFQNGRMPANLIRPYEAACGIDYVTRWIASSDGKLLIDMPTGRTPTSGDVAALHSGFATGVKLLTDFYTNGGDNEALVAALTNHLADVAWHRANAALHATPELDFSA